MKLKKITEGSTQILVNDCDKVSSELDVFYNPVMEINRTISVLFLRAIDYFHKPITVALPLAASGIRGIRLIREVGDKIGTVQFNDRSETTIDILKQNLELNQIEWMKKEDFDGGEKRGHIMISHNDANRFLLNNFQVDYIDIDPFGSPMDFVHNSLAKLNKIGILAVTATDTAALAGNSPNACMRRYFAVPENKENKKEFSLRILAGRIIREAALFNIALRPILSHATDHYCRIYFQAKPGKKRADKLLQDVKSITRDGYNYHIKNSDDSIGPMYLGSLSDSDLINKMLSDFETDHFKDFNYKKEIVSELTRSRLIEKINLPYGYSIVEIYRSFTNGKQTQMPKLSKVIELIELAGFKAVCVDHKYITIKTNMPYEQFYTLLKSLNNLF